MKVSNRAVDRYRSCRAHMERLSVTASPQYKAEIALLSSHVLDRSLIQQQRLTAAQHIYMSLSTPKMLCKQKTDSKSCAVSKPLSCTTLYCHSVQQRAEIRAGLSPMMGVNQSAINIQKATVSATMPVLPPSLMPVADSAWWHTNVLVQNQAPPFPYHTGTT